MSRRLCGHLGWTVLRHDKAQVLSSTAPEALKPNLGGNLPESCPPSTHQIDLGQLNQLFEEQEAVIPERADHFLNFPEHLPRISMTLNKILVHEETPGSLEPHQSGWLVGM